MNIKIRKARKWDIEMMVALLQSLFAIEDDFIVDPEKQRTGLLHLLVRGREGIIFVAEIDSAVVGMVTAQRVVSTAAGGYAVLLEDMVVVEPCRHQGVGFALLHAVLGWAATIDAKRIQLLADQRNQPALVFYKKLGFSGSRMRGFYRLLGGGTNENEKQ